MSSRHRFLERSINHVSLHNRLTEEEAMWRRRGQEQETNEPQRHRSRSSHHKRTESIRKHRSSSSNERNEQKRVEQQPEAEFGPPLPSNLGVNADRWDHALFMQRYPDEYEKQMKKSKRKSSTSSEDEKSKKKHSKRHHHRRDRGEEHKKKRRHRSRSRS